MINEAGDANALTLQALSIVGFGSASGRIRSRSTLLARDVAGNRSRSRLARRSIAPPLEQLDILARHPQPGRTLMANSNRQPNGSSDGSPSGKKKTTKVKRPKTDLSAFLLYPISAMDEPAFAQLCEQIRSLLAPQSAFETRAVEAILWSFKRIRDAQKAIILGDKGAATFYKYEVESFRAGQRALDGYRKLIEAEREYLDSLASPSRSSPSQPLTSAIPLSTEPAPEPEPSPEFLPRQNFWRAAEATFEPAPAPEPEPTPEPVVEPILDEEEFFDEVDEIEGAAEDWRARIAMVPAVDPRWPVLDQFDLRVDDILTLRDRGVPEEEILEQHPGLTFMDLSSCYACEAEGYRGPLEPPYPVDITLVDDNADSD